MIRERAQSQGKQAGTAPNAAKKAAPAVSTADWSSLVALTDLTTPYKGEDGGLYGGGRNDPPAAHHAAHLKISSAIQPLDAEGRSAVDGKIGLITIGFSNTSIESEDFIRAAHADAQKSPHVVIVNGAIGKIQSPISPRPKIGF